MRLPEWEPVDMDGMQRHRPCGGSGKVPDDLVKRGKTRCHGCAGEGYRRAKVVAEAKK